MAINRSHIFVGSIFKCLTIGMMKLGTKNEFNLILCSSVIAPRWAEFCNTLVVKSVQTITLSNRLSSIQNSRASMCLILIATIVKGFIVCFKT